MTFHVYRRQSQGEVDVLHLTGEQFSLAGHNLLYLAWKKRGKPIRQGWRISADELIRIYSDNTESETRRLIIDYHPSNMERIPLIEVEEIFLFNWNGDSSGSVAWTPMMLRLRDVVDEWLDTALSQEDRRQRMSRLAIETYGEPFIEFLYLKGDDGGWNWGRNGATNAVFLNGEARDYFRQFF